MSLLKTSDPGSYPYAMQGQNGEEDWDDAYDPVGDIFEAQTVVKSFVKCLLNGLPVSLLSVHKSAAPCKVFVDRRLSTLELQRDGKADATRRKIPLEDIAEVVVGEFGGKDFDLWTDALSVTLVLVTGQGMGIRFTNEEDRDTFALCISMFVDGRRAEILQHAPVAR
eukprot:CAMPEP_0206420208 /NCGR_PEP_ID=MMETSP0324_2-20121206/672_1 /ASSEMBLY_ACC=CAM_ASM_000836 /TAXON_ID=2866 /ORGANISM="Crypthecodinium cohnii, Strain Seligo" /LENGTH=166 /DNA_ID=CAMNT_0053883981 /DNA_START=136 /DNA_END=636 /DNA_ORIENTATION=-